MDNVIIMCMWIKKKKKKKEETKSIIFLHLSSPTTPRAHSQMPHSRLNGQIYLTQKSECNVTHAGSFINQC